MKTPTPTSPREDRPERDRERFRATARHIATQIDIEETMWRMLDRPGFAASNEDTTDRRPT